MVENIPLNSDPLIGLHRIASYSNQHHRYYYDYMTHYPVASDQELLAHYMYGSAGPFMDLLTYVDMGVGWTLTPVDFKDEDIGLEAVDIVEKELFKRDFQATMMQFAVYYLVLGRACLIKMFFTFFVGITLQKCFTHKSMFNHIFRPTFRTI